MTGIHRMSRAPYSAQRIGSATERPMATGHLTGQVSLDPENEMRRSLNSAVSLQTARNLAS